jgi:DNA polymerase-3 subunit delta
MVKETKPRDDLDEQPNHLVWLVTGSEPALVSEEIARLTRQLLEGTDRSLALDEFAASDNPEELIWTLVGTCGTGPFLADRRVVVLRDLGQFTGEQLGPLIDYIKQPLDSTRLVLGAGGGQLSAKLLNSVKASPTATLVNTDPGSGKAASGWIHERLVRAPVRLSHPAAELLEQHLGEDLARLSSLLDTLAAAYGRDAQIGPEQLEPYLGQAGTVPPWDFTDAIDRGQPALALQLLHRLMSAGERHPLVVLAILHRHFSNVLKVQAPSVRTEAQAAAALGIAQGRSTFPAKKALDAARKLGPRGAGDAIMMLADAELDIKGRTGMDPETVMDILVARLCRMSKGAQQPAGAPAGSQQHGGSRDRYRQVPA